MSLFDTHAHIHDSEFDFVATVLEDAHAAGVEKILCIGTDLRSSKEAIDYAQRNDGVWASIGLHPHEAALYAHDQQLLAEFTELATAQKVVAIGECGLDYYYMNSPIDDQQAILRYQLALALKHNLPVSFHVREAFDDFWPILDEFPGIRGVLHSFTDTEANLREGLRRGLYIGVNGIMTFTKDMRQLDMLKAIPQERLLLETDAPFLTPSPKRGKMNEPKFLGLTASFVSEHKNVSLDELVRITSENANTLFGTD